METSTAPLFDSAFLAKLEQLHLLARKLFHGEHHAERRSRQTGSSLEFADYREYTPGDHLRSIDWHAYSRLDRLFVKLFEQEQDLPISFFIDASASMRWSPADRPGLTKFDQARRIAASLAYIALANLDRVNVHFFAADLLSEMGVVRGKAHFHGVLDFLTKAPQPDGPTRLLPNLHSFARRMKRRGLVFVLSDFFDPAGYEEPLALLRHHQFDIHILQILAPEELSPTETGDLRLVETETSEPMEVTASESLLRRYREEITAYNEGLESFCHQRSIGHATITTEAAFEDVVLKVLRDGSMLK